MTCRWHLIKAYKCLYMLSTPLLFLVFNRIESTKLVFEKIKWAKPNKLFIASDGPRNDRKMEAEQVKEVREFVINSIDWQCDVKTLFRKENLGCRKAVSEAITWFFENVEMGVILEDDCLPDVSFFKFCDELLMKFRNDERVGMISGNNFGFILYDKELSYTFSKHGLIWGWASWARAWNKFNFVQKGLKDADIELISSCSSNNSNFIHFWWADAIKTLNNKIDSWAYLWGITRYANNYLTIRPKDNLVANIGFGRDATHTFKGNDMLFTKTEPVQFPLVHCPFIVPDMIADNQLETFLVNKWIKKNKISKLRKILRQLKRMFQD